VLGMSRRDLQLYLSANWYLIYEDIDLFGRSRDTCDLKIVSNILCGWMKTRTLIQLCGSRCQSYCASRMLKVQLLAFLFLALFVVLQVIVEWLRWAGFNDGAGSLLLNWKILWGVWITVLGDDWCWVFKVMEGGGQGIIIWSWMRKWGVGNFSFGNGRS
jgi:hypothetical protein